MSMEGRLEDRKSLRTVTGKTADWDSLAKDCVVFEGEKRWRRYWIWG